jgi:adenylate cyclase
MRKEIERKYLVQSDAWRDRVQSKEQYQQGYLSTDEERSVRVRVGKRKAFFTIKGKATGHTRAEFEYSLPLEDAHQLLEHLCVKPLITKTRHKVQVNGLTWEIDEFSGENSPLILAELETKSDKAPKQKPAWVGEEVTQDPRYLNIHLVTHPYSTWGKEILHSTTAFHLKGGESVPNGLKRIVIEQLTEASNHLSHSEAVLEEPIHEVRKSVKRLRAVLRLMRPVLGSAYREENAALQGVGRTLSPVRDAHALLETFDELTEKYRKEVGEHHTSRLRQTLLAHRQEVENEFDRDRRMPQLVEELRQIGLRAESWPYGKVDIRLLADGVATTLERGGKSYHHAYTEPLPENFHDWRKRAKDLRYQLTLLEKLWPEVFAGFLSTAKKLEELLGMDHNLVVLRDTILKRAEVVDSDEEIRGLLLLIDTYQQELRVKAEGLGVRIYNEKPKQWKRRVERSWEVGRKEQKIKRRMEKHPALAVALS